MCGLRIIGGFERHSLGKEVVVVNPGSKMCEKAVILCQSNGGNIHSIIPHIPH